MKKKNITQEISKADILRAEQQINQVSKKIEYSISEFTIEILALKLERKELFIPNYQREFTWEKERKSRFIESILMGLPIPFIFFWEKSKTGKLEIVDGSQRLRTIHEFIHGDLRLAGLERLHELNDFSYKDLKESRQLKFINKSIRGIILNSKADAIARLDLFERINTGSKTANSSEIRRGVLQGPFMELVTELAESKLFITLTPIKESLVKEREREELVSRFFAYSDGIENYSNEVKSFIDNYIQTMNQKFTSDSTLKIQYQERFNKIMSFINDNFPHGFRKSEASKAVPRARYESLAIGTYLASQECENIDVLKENIDKLLSNQTFAKKVTSDGANVRSKLEGRLYVTRDILLGRSIS